MRNFQLILFLLLSSMTTFAQGTIRGIVVDGETQEPLIGSVVRVEGTSAGAVTDIDGAYSIQLPAGTYTVVHTYIGYQDKNISEVVVTDNEVNSLGTINLDIGGDDNMIEAVTITAYVQKNTEEGLLNFQRESTKIVDAVSSQSIAKTGDSDVAAVVKRVPGVTIEGGKYVFVRGLGDRYSKSVLNGLEIPGLDPDRNAVQLDIFPSNIIDNIVVYKTFSPDLAGDFTGGMVDITTKDFPQEETLNASISLGYNNETTFNDNYYNANNVSFGDVVGFGKSSRELPFSKSFQASSANNQELFNTTNALNKELDPMKIDNFLNQSLSFSYGNQYEVSETNKLGVNGAVNYRNNYSVRPNVERNNFVIVPNSNSYELFANDKREGLEGYNEGMLNAILGASIKNIDNKYSLKLLHTRTGEASSTDRLNEDEFNDINFAETTLDYFQRTISNVLLDGENYFKNESELDYGVSYTYSTVDNPDRTSTKLEQDPNTTDLLFGSGSSFVNKQWRELSENSVNGKINYTIPFENIGIANEKSTVKIGGAANYKVRDFEVYNVTIDKSNPFNGDLVRIENGHINQILQTGNIVTPTQDGYEISSLQVDQDNKFNSDMMISAGYLMADYYFTDRVKFIGGLRAENATMNYDGIVRENGIARDYDKETLNSTQILPSVNFIFEPIDYMNVRASYNRTLARPSFKEKSGAIIYDAIQDQRYYGNINLEETTIDNMDIRWEYFFTESEVVSVSPFYKRFDQPIELTFRNANEVEPLNKSEADVYGFEIEARKNFGFIDESLEELTIKTNFTFVESEIELTDNEKLKYSRNNLSVPENRDMLGQSPYSVNASLGYSGFDNGWEANLGYNVKGKTLSIVGIADIPDVYEDPFHNLDFKLSKYLGDKLGSKLSINASNLLNDNIEYYYNFPNVSDAIYNSYDVGQTFSVGYSLNLNQ